MSNVCAIYNILLNKLVCSAASPFLLLLPKEHKFIIELYCLACRPPHQNVTVIIAAAEQISIYHHINSRVRAVLTVQLSRMGPRGERERKKKQKWSYECKS